MKNNIIRKKLMVFGLVCSMAMSMVSAPALAAGTEPYSETESESESQTQQTETESESQTQPLSETLPSESETYMQGTESGSQSEETETQGGGAEVVLDDWDLTSGEGVEGLYINGVEGEDYIRDADKTIIIKSNKALEIKSERGPGVEFTGQIIIEADEAKLKLIDVNMNNSAGRVLTVQEGKKLELTLEGTNKFSVDVSVNGLTPVELKAGAELVIGAIGDNASLNVEGTSRGKSIIMSRGEKKEQPGEEKDKPSSLTITGGTIIAKEGILVRGNESQKVVVKVTGGSVQFLEDTTEDRSKISIIGDDGTEVYQTSLTLSSAEQSVNNIAILSGGAAYTYGTEGICTDENNKIYLYLPAKQTVVTAAGTAYAGEVKTSGTTELAKESAMLTVEPVTVPALTYGDTADKIVAGAVTVKNASVNSTTVTAELTGANRDGFTLTPAAEQTDGVTVPGKTDTAVGINTEIRIQPKESLLDKGAGKYETTLTITDASGKTTPVTVSFTINKAKLTPEAKIDEKVYDGKRTGSGTVTLKGAMYGEKPKIVENKVSYKFNSANAKDAKKVTVSELELQEEYAKNYELALDRFEVEASIKKAPNDNDKEDLKKPSVTAVYNKEKGIWQPKMTTYEGQEYLFFGSSRTELTEKNKKSENWEFGDNKTKSDRIVSMGDKNGKPIGLKSGTTYTVWTRFAGDDNHEPSDGDAMAYTTFSVGSSGGDGTSVSESNNRIKGLTEGTTYKIGSRLAFGAEGAGMTNTSPKTGDERYIPLSWKVSEEHTWSSAPYEAAFTINQAGSYTLQVTFRKQTYSNNSWVNTSTTSVKSVNFKMASDGANGTGYTTSGGNSPSTGSGTGSSGSGSNSNSGSGTKTNTAAKTGDDSPIIPLLVVCLASALVVGGILWKKRKDDKEDEME